MKDQTPAFVTYRSTGDKSIIEILYMIGVNIDDITPHSFIYVTNKGKLVLIEKENKYDEPKDMAENCEIGYVNKQGAGSIKKIKDKYKLIYGEKGEKNEVSK